MIGSILSNLLLVMGMCFFFGGIVNMRDENGLGTEQSFASITAQTTCSLMTLAAASMIIPGAVSPSKTALRSRFMWAWANSFSAIHGPKFHRRR